MGDVLVSDDGPVRTVRMHRPDKKNALTQPMYDTMAAAIEEAADRPSLRCLLIAGGDTFCAGNDIADFAAMAAQGGALAAPVLRFLHALAGNEKPLVAAVRGNAVGVGTTMLLHCDYVVAAADARFATPFVGLGLLPEAASSLLAPRLMGQRHAFSLLVMGQPMTAERARDAGLVNAVTAPETVDAEALEAARAIAALPPQAVTIARWLMRGPREEIDARIDEEAALFKERMRSAEARAAFEAFLTRKK